VTATTAVRPPAGVRRLTTAVNRGALLDLTVFVLNLLVMRHLARLFIGIAARAGGDDQGAQAFLGIYFGLMFVLPAAGAVLKRWHFHQRRAAMHESGNPYDQAWGCLANPIWFFTVSLLLATTAGVVFASRIFGEDFDSRPGIFLTLIFGVLIFSIVQTVLVYRYFSPPAHPPRSAFLRDERSETVADTCIFLNMILFQVLWNVVLSGRFPHPGGIEDLLGRLFLLWFLAILIYFPPRVFYLPEDAHRRRSWLTILLANAPPVLHVVFGLF
jgi:hypothetical protein